ncbi:MAG: hypothetical protein DRN99_01905 [Thermoproteota archaeon]|nr:MAG: hypothetical protein DRN99_01905 [Candidatus Korarchaeota archaeon]
MSRMKGALIGLYAGNSKRIAELAGEATNLGYSIVAVMANTAGSLKVLREALPESKHIKLGAHIACVEDWRTEIGEARRYADIIVAEPKSLQRCRAATSHRGIDLIALRVAERKLYFDDVSARQAQERGAAVIVYVSDLWGKGTRELQYGLRVLKTELKIASTRRVPVLLGAEVRTRWDLRSPRVLMALATVMLNLDPPMAANAITVFPRVMLERGRELALLKVRGVRAAG